MRRWLLARYEAWRYWHAESWVADLPVPLLVGLVLLAVALVLALLRAGVSALVERGGL